MIFTEQTYQGNLTFESLQFVNPIWVIENLSVTLDSIKAYVYIYDEFTNTMLEVGVDLGDELFTAENIINNITNTFNTNSND